MDSRFGRLLSWRSHRPDIIAAAAAASRTGWALRYGGVRTGMVPANGEFIIDNGRV